MTDKSSHVLYMFLNIDFTHFWSPTESGGGSLWLHTFFAQPKVCEHHVALHTHTQHKQDLVFTFQSHKYNDTYYNKD